MISATHPPQSRLGQQICGALIGHTAGDCLGATTEFLTPAQVRANYGKVTDIVGGGAFNWRPGQGTDDTDLSVIVVDSYLANGGRLNIHDVGQRLIDWADRRPPDIGTTTAAGIRSLRTYGDPTRSGVTTNHAAGNGSLMRTVAVGIVNLNNPDARRADAIAISAVTHAAPDCVDACVAYSDIVAHLLHSATPAEAIAATLHERTLTTKVANALEDAASGLRDDLGTSGWVIDSLTIAVAGLVTAEAAGVEAVLIDIANRGNDADTNAAIAGGLLGARHGIAEIPTRWIDRLEQADHLTDASHKLTALVAS